MYLLFKNIDARTLGNVQVIGSWNNFAVGFIPDTHTDIIEYRHLNAKVLDEGVAWAWMYFGQWRGYISVRTGTPQNDKLQILSSQEATGEKARYTLTDEDKTNTTTLMKEIMRMMLDEIFDKRLIQLNVSVSNLEAATWEQQKAEALANGGPLLQTLADARGITLEEMVTKVLSAIENYNVKVAELLARKQLIEQEVKACQNIGDCNRLMHNRFELEMPVAQRSEEAIEYSAKYDI
jgi:hypothetical protein